MDKGLPVARWFHDAKVVYATVTTVVIAAVAFWHFGGSTLFAYDRRLAVIEEQHVHIQKSFDGIKGQVDALDTKVVAFEIRMARLETKMDTIIASFENIERKLDVVADRLSTLPQPKPKPKIAKRAMAKTSWLAWTKPRN